jgi:hypothetical protein
MSKEGILSLVDIWEIVKERRFEAYEHKGILYFERDADGVVQERYFKSFDGFAKKYSDLNRKGLMVDLSREKR